MRPLRPVLFVIGFAAALAIAHGALAHLLDRADVVERALTATTLADVAFVPLLGLLYCLRAYLFFIAPGAIAAVVALGVVDAIATSRARNTRS